MLCLRCCHLQVLLAPGDTFRAAAAEQLAEWARRSGAKIGTFKEGGRPGGVLAAACNDAKQQKDVDVVICDTAGRLHTAYALMEELANCRWEDVLFCCHVTCHICYVGVAKKKLQAQA
jgi:signal recognition particle GTPase